MNKTSLCLLIWLGASLPYSAISEEVRRNPILPSMPIDLRKELDSSLIAAYTKCWAKHSAPTSSSYVALIRVGYDQSGKIIIGPFLSNPPTDPELRAVALGAMKAVKDCDPLNIDPKFAPYYNAWKTRILRFDPKAAPSPTTKAE